MLAPKLVQITQNFLRYASVLTLMHLNTYSLAILPSLLNNASMQSGMPSPFSLLVSRECKLY
uniref:Uncharacterized protein n=1 Tax=Arundo donax TaxID=35708 RepID=A0A0A9EN80_ARUDO